MHGEQGAIGEVLERERDDAGSPVRQSVVATTDVPVGTRRVVRNAGMDPLVLAVLTIAPAATEPATPTS